MTIWSQGTASAAVGVITESRSSISVISWCESTIWFPCASHHYPWQNQSRTTAHYAHKQPLCTLCPLITYIGYMRQEREYLRMFAHGYDIIVLSMSPWLSLLTPKLSHHHSRGSRLWYMPLFKCLEKFSAPSFAWYSTHLQLRSSTLLPRLDSSNYVNLASGASTHSPSVSAMCQLHFFFGFWRFHLELRHLCVRQFLHHRNYHLSGPAPQLYPS